MPVYFVTIQKYERALVAAIRQSQAPSCLCAPGEVLSSIELGWPGQSALGRVGAVL